MKKDPILYVPNIDWSDPDDIERLFEKNIFGDFENDPLMIGEKLSGLEDRIGMFHQRKMPQATLRHNLGQLPATRFNKLVIERGQELVDPSLAILMRVFDKYPNLCPLFPFVDIEVLMEKCGIDSKRELSLLLGRDQVSATRYTSVESRKSPSPTTMMLTYIMYLFNEAGRLDEYREIVHKEAKHRGTDNLVSTGFPKVKPAGLDLVRLLKEKSTKILKEKEPEQKNLSDVEFAKLQDAFKARLEKAQDVINKCVSYMSYFHEIRVITTTLNDHKLNVEAIRDKDPERAAAIEEDIAFNEKQLEINRENEQKLLQELKEISKTL